MSESTTMAAKAMKEFAQSNMPSVHLQTNNPDCAWKSMSLTQRVKTLEPKPLNTPVFPDKVSFF